MAATAGAVESTVGLDEIHVAENVRALDVDHVRALAESIRLQGMLVPVVSNRPKERSQLAAGSTSSLPASTGRQRPPSCGWPRSPR